jgi:hypothetical protein
LRKRQPPGGRGGKLVMENLGQGRHAEDGKELARNVKGG